MERRTTPRFLLALALFALPFAGLRAQVQLVAGACIAAPDSTLVPTGTFQVQFTDGQDQPVFVSAGGLQITAESARRDINYGSITDPITIPDPSTSVPANYRMRVTVTNLATNKVTVYRTVEVKPSNGLFDWCHASLAQSYRQLPFVPVVGPTGAQGATSCIVGQTCTTSLTPKSVGGTFYAAGFGAVCNGTFDDTSAMQAALTAARSANTGGTTSPLVLPPGNCKVAQTLDLTGIDFIGQGGKHSKATQLSPTTTNPGRDMLQTKGNTRLAHMVINGGWDGHTTGLSGNGLSILSSPGPGGYVGYVVGVDDVSMQNMGHECVNVNDGAYDSFHDFQCNAVGLHDFEATSFNYPGFQTTTISFTGQTMLSDAPNGYGLVCTSCISTSMSGSVTTSENTHGLLFAGSGRNIDFSHLYLEATRGGKCMTFAGSDGIGLVLSDNYGPGCIGPTADDLALWKSVSVFSNDFGTANFNDGVATVVRSGNATNTGPLLFRQPIDTTLNTTWAPLGAVTFTPGHAWRAEYDGVALDGVTHAALSKVHINSSYPSFSTGATTVTCSVNSSGTFGCATTSGFAILSGELTVVVDKQYAYSVQTGVFSGPIQTGGVTSSGPVNGSTVKAANGFSGFVTSVGQFCSGVLISASAATCH